MRPPTMTAHGAVPAICAARGRAITSGADSARATTTVVTMTGVAENRVTKAGAAAAAIAAQEPPQIFLRADRSLRYGAIAPTVAACREAGIPSIRLATEETP